jgi:hypothetical protein
MNLITVFGGRNRTIDILSEAGRFHWSIGGVYPPKNQVMSTGRDVVTCCDLNSTSSKCQGFGTKEEAVGDGLTHEEHMDSQ